MDVKLNSNLWKLFVNQLTQKRYYIPILSIFFLTLPDATAKQIGLWSGIGFLSEFLFEIPSGYLSDKIGHKKTLILSKIFMLLASIFFVIANSLIYFILGAVFTSLSYASQSGTRPAFLHETLVSLKREKDFIKTSSKITAKVALLSIPFLIIIPYFAEINIRLPLVLSIILDVIGLLVVISLVNPKFHEKIKETKSFLNVFKETRGSGFFSLAIFTSAITGFIIASNRYVYPHIELIGFPIGYLGIIMGLSALVQYIVGNNIDKFENTINIKKIFIFDLFLFSLTFILIGFLKNPYLTGVILILVFGYELGRRTFINSYLLKNHITNRNYKATILSFKGQITMIFNFTTVFIIGFFMDSSYSLGFYIMGISLFLILVISYFSISKKHILRS